MKVDLKMFTQWRKAGIITRCRTYNAGGPGGQHQNRTESAVELIGEVNIWDRNGETLIETVTVQANASTARSQHENKRRAMVILYSKLLAEIKRVSRGQEDRKLTAGFSPEGRVRNYHQPDNRVQNAGDGHRERYDETFKPSAKAFGRLVEANREAKGATSRRVPREQ